MSDTASTVLQALGGAGAIAAAARVVWGAIVAQQQRVEDLLRKAAEQAEARERTAAEQGEARGAKSEAARLAIQDALREATAANASVAKALDAQREAIAAVSRDVTRLEDLILSSGGRVTREPPHDGR